MTYEEKIAWLTKAKTDYQGMEDKSFTMKIMEMDNEVYEYEKNVFLTLVNNILSEKKKIEFLLKIKDKHHNEMFQHYCDSEVLKYKEKIKEYMDEINKLYSKKSIYDYYEARKTACQGRIDYAKKELEKDSQSKVANISLKDSEREMAELIFALTLLSGSVDSLDEDKTL